MTDAPPMAYSVLKRGLRPSRVAMVFDGGEFWSYHARRALYLANQVWGGAGFALIPHHDGVVNPVLLHAVQAYDPDFVVASPRSVEDIAYSDKFGGGRTPSESREYATLLAGALSTRQVTAGDLQARDTVAEVCSPYFQPAEDTPREALRSFSGPSKDFPRALDVPGAETGHVLACPPNWGGTVGAAVAAHAGVVEPPNPGASEPDLDRPTVARLAQWLLGGSPTELPMDLVWFPTVATSIFPHEAPLSHRRTMAGIERVYSGFPGGEPALIVIGDSVDDFALAHLWKLTYGRGAWLPSALGADEDRPSWGLHVGLAELLDEVSHQPGSMLFTSASRTTGDVQSVHDRFFGDPGAEEVSSDADHLSRPVPVGELPWRRTGTSHLAVDEQYDDALPVPIVLEDTGTRSMAAPSPPATLLNPDLAAHTELTWHIDFAWQPSMSVLGRGLPGHSLFSEVTNPWLTLARSSRQGISHRSRRFDFVIGGIPQVNRIPRPAFKDLSLADWVGAKARQNGYSTVVKGAGGHTIQLGRMLGGRESFLDLFAGPLLPALRGFQAKGNSTREAYPAHDGVRIQAGEGVLSFAGICARSGPLTASEVRDRLDPVLRAGVLTRGLVLRCATCDEVQFQAVDKLRQRWVCVRCDAVNDLDRTSWHDPVEEPTWFYDLHPIARRLLKEHGEIPALLAGQLALAARGKESYRDLAEITFVEGGKPSAEIDLIAYRGNTLIVAECKSADHLDGANKKRKAETIKKCRIARLLRADLLIFATTAEAWQAATRMAIADAVREFEWSAIGAPTLEFVENLDGPAR
ncbi:hypothetical protein [Amycolatopsis sp. cg9]|uniref:hypothetical protein n=1 Tax=Amycolatopsis sp. cg9 TaxID=3238801 RepID=UPI003524D6A7